MARLLLQVLCASVAMAALWAAPASAATRCGPSGTPGTERCVTGLPAPLLARMHQLQQGTQWCWAASISMVLRRYGVDVPQAQIVDTHLGGLRDESITAEDLAGLLSREWRDGDGRRLQASAEAVPKWRAFFGVAAPEVLAELEQDRPVILGLQRHAVVLVEVVYERSAGAASGPVRLLRAVVLDPALQVGLRSLRPADGDVISLMRVHVQAEAQVAQAAR